MTVGEKIKTFRTIRGISQNVLGELASIDGTTIPKAKTRPAFEDCQCSGREYQRIHGLRHRNRF